MFPVNADGTQAERIAWAITTEVIRRPVTKGDLLGTVTDYAGQEIERIVLPVDGYIMHGLAGPPVRAGEAVVTIGIPAATPR